MYRAQHNEGALEMFVECLNKGNCPPPHLLQFLLPTISSHPEVDESPSDLLSEGEQ